MNKIIYIVSLTSPRARNPYSIVIADWHQQFLLLTIANCDGAMLYSIPGVHRAIKLDDLLKNKGYHLEQGHQLLKEQSKKVATFPTPSRMPIFTILTHMSFLLFCCSMDDELTQRLWFWILKI